MNRAWSVRDIPSPEVLAIRLTELGWRCCTGFRFGGFLWLNDSHWSEGPQTYAVVQEQTLQQVESVTFTWYSLPKALLLIERMLRGPVFPMTGQGVRIEQVQRPDQHGSCAECL